MRRLFGRIEWEALPTSEAALLIGVSGGADSVFLARGLAAEAPRRGWSLIVAHVHHGLRGEEADGDQAFVEQLAAELGIPCMISRIEPGTLAGETSGGGSLEARLREARWGVLAALARACGCDAIVAGHHRDDLAETFLLQALRGAGLTGLGSLKPRGQWEDVDVIRPLLDIGRDEIRDALRADGFSWREDRSNLDPAFKRNWVRLEILPALESYQQGVVAALARTARVSAEESEELQRQGRVLLEEARAAAVEAGGRGVKAAGGNTPRETASPGATSRSASPCDALDWGRTRGESSVLTRHALRAWICDVSTSPLSPALEAILDVIQSAETARSQGGETFVVSIPGLVVWTDGRWILAGPSRGHADLDAEALRRTLEPWFIHWRELWGLPLLLPDSQSLPAPSSESNDTPECEFVVTSDGQIADESRGWPSEAGEPVREKRIRMSSTGSILVHVGPRARLLPNDWQMLWRDRLVRETTAVFDLDGIHGDMRVRALAAGDGLAMNGGGHKDALDALAEAGIPLALRRRVPVIADAEGPLWIPGIRRAGRAWIADSTTRVLLVATER